jgi:hypothetical protein
MQQIVIQSTEIENRIITIRGLQVMLDSHLAEMFLVETKALNRAVKRNQERFPNSFCFQLTDLEYDSLRYQFGTLKQNKGVHRKYLPYTFTEQGVAMLSAVLRSETAVKVSVQIMNAFVAMRKTLSVNTGLFQRVESLEVHKIVAEKKFEQLFTALESRSALPDKGIFFDGQIFDAYVFISDLIRKAEQSIILIDNYVDDSVLKILTKRKPKVSVSIFTKTISKQMELDLQKHNQQYAPITIKVFPASHDRFIILDQKELYHIGASLKDLGKKWFAFSKMDSCLEDILKRL